MPKRRAARGRRGGGAGGKKTAQAAVEGDGAAEVTLDLNSSNETAVGFELDAVHDSINEDSGMEHAIDEVQVLNQDTAECLSEAETGSDLEKNAAVEEGQGDIGSSKEGPGERVESLAEDEKEEVKTDLNSICETAVGFAVKTVDDGINKDVGTKHVAGSLDADPCSDLEKNTTVEEEKHDNELEEELLGTVDSIGDNKETSAEVCFVDKEVESEQKEVEEIQYIDEEAWEDQQLADIVEGNSSKKTVAAQNSELTGKGENKEVQDVQCIDEVCEDQKTVAAQNSELTGKGENKEVQDVQCIDEVCEDQKTVAAQNSELTGKGENKEVQDVQCIDEVCEDQKTVAAQNSELTGKGENKEVQDVQCIDEVCEDQKTVAAQNSELTGKSENKEVQDVQCIDEVCEDQQLADIMEGTSAHNGGSHNESDQNEVEEIQYIDEEACEDQPLADIMKSPVNQMINATQNKESQKEIDTGKGIENPNDLSENCEVLADSVKPSAVESQDEEADNSKFEEISDGSIDQDQIENAAEAISDVEIIGESFVPKKTQNKKNINARKEKIKVPYKEAESLEEVFFATENDDVKITAEDKDNDYISDASLSDHANLSLEEISDDEMEPSKKKKKPSEMTPVKADKVDEKTNPDAESITKSDEKSEGIKTNQKRTANDDVGGIEGNSSKKLKMSGEIKIVEETQKSENEPDLGSESKKERSKPQAKEPESRERFLSSRDLEYWRKFDLVSTMSQTEPRMVKGKIVQCNINQIKSTPEIGQPKHSENGVTVSKLLNKYRNQLPASIPEKIFSEVTSLLPPQKENTYSFSMGPVTLSDIDCPKFRDVLRGAEEFSLAFNIHCQGILKATIVKHESLSLLISQLKCLELGNRYMVMSVGYNYGSERSLGVWKATLMFMYEQDIQMESQRLVSDEKIRAKLCLKGVPKDVSKDFVHLLFPEAISVSTGPGTLEERAIMLGFSNTKIVEEILSCYDLLVICGSQINISHIDSPEIQQNLPADVTDESVPIIIVEDTKDSEEISEKQDVFVTVEQENYKQQESEPHVESTNKTVSEDIKQTEDSKQDQIKPDDSADLQGQEKGSLNTDESKSLLIGTDSCVEKAQTAAETKGIETVCTADHPAEDVEMNAENVGDKDIVEQTDRKVTSVSDNGNNEVEEAVVATSENAEHSKSSESVDASKPSDSVLDEAVITQNVATDEDSKKQANLQDNVVSDVGLLKNTEVPSECVADNRLENAGKDTAEGKVCDEMVENFSATISEKEVNAVDNKDTNEKKLEDVSDEEIVNQSKLKDPEDVVILREDSTQWVAASIDLTNEEIDVSGKVLNERKIDLTEEKGQQPINHNENIDVKTATTDKNVDHKLVMTDGDLEVTMEVTDVDEGDKEVEKVIYARPWRQSPDRSREKNVRDIGYSTPAYMPWQENQWSYTNRPDTFRNSRGSNRYYPAREDVSRIPRNYYSPMAQMRDTYYPKRRSAYPPDNRTSEHRDRNYDIWRPSTYGESRRPEAYSRPLNESSSRQAHWQSRSTAYYTPPTWHDSQQASVKPGDHYSRSDSRGPHYSDRRRDYRKSRSRSLSDKSSPGDQLPPARRSYRRESPKRPVMRTSRSPISVSSRSRSLSPVSKSPSVVRTQAGAGKEELVKTVKHFLELAKGIQQSHKRRSNRSRSPKSPSLRHSKTPSPKREPLRLRSPPISGSLVRKAVRNSRHTELSPRRMRSRSPQPRNSRSPTYTRGRRYKHERSPSTSSSEEGDKRHRGNRSYTERRGDSDRKSESPDRLESKRSQKPVNYSQPSGQGSEPKYRSSSNQPWQQPVGGYQMPQSSGPAPTSNVYNPTYPPPVCVPQQQASVYSGSPMPVYPYSAQSQYSYSSIPPSFVQNFPPPPSVVSYPSPYYQTPPQPIAPTGHPTAPTGHQNAPLQSGTSDGMSSSNSSSKNKKSWSMGSSAMVFQRVLGTAMGDKSGTIGKSERFERPKLTKPDRVLTKVQMEKK